MTEHEICFLDKYLLILLIWAMPESKYYFSIDVFQIVVWSKAPEHSRHIQKRHLFLAFLTKPFTGIMIVKMTGETPEVRSDKRKPRERK